ncbi:MAG: amidohydrolase family protein [Steroidobacteraceae bacterium]
MMRVDSHMHFWRFHGDDYPWMSDAMQVLKCDRLPGEARPLLDRQNIDQGVAVQARVSEQETDFLLDLAARNPWIGAVIGWVDLRNANLQQSLDRWADKEKLAGFRHPLQGDPEAGALVSDSQFKRGVALLQSRSMIYELLISADQLPAVTDFCRSSDDGWLVLDHLGKPDIRGGGFNAWRRDVSEVAAFPHVVCKLSGLVTEATDASGNFDAEGLRKYLDTALTLFGPQRLMFGSDWPVCLLAAPYAEVADIVERWSAGLSATDREWIWGGTAAHVYGLMASSMSRGSQHG